MKANNKHILALAIIVKDLVVRLCNSPLSTKETQEMVDNLNIIMDDLTKPTEPKKKRSPSIKICLGCGSFAHGNPGHDISI